MTEAGTVSVASPWVVLYGAGAAHANTVGLNGFEQIEIELDPDWLKLNELKRLRAVRHWVGGSTWRRANDLAHLWARSEVSETRLRDATLGFLAAAARAENCQTPSWVPSVLNRIETRPETPTLQLAADLKLNPHWLAQAYRRAIGEGIRETARRIRVERAAAMLRTTELPPAEIAAGAGFCDQSHMIRCFLKVLGRTPLDVRREWSRA